MNGRLRLAAATMGVLALAGCGSMAINQSAAIPSQSLSTSPKSAHIPTTGILVGTDPGDHDLHPAWTAYARQVAGVRPASPVPAWSSTGSVRGRSHPM